MRFLNKITFINSASIKYAEINLDGNVHFIGTQGVGKSTLLRAILFFYNADKGKLGISREKKNFDSYYFPFQNSYIIFEVVKGHSIFSVIAFKSNGRVAFRFLDSPYKKRFFINDEGVTYETWDKIKAILKQETNFSKIISNYEEYRNILYGNNLGLDPDLKKYALLESKQYHNIPRTIQNVFLNTKLDAEFIKETIIKSLDEEQLKIDLSTYSQTHFKDFDTELNDIQLWSKENKQGEIVVRQQAEEVSKTYRALTILDKEKINIAKKLGWSIQSIQTKLPQLKQGLQKEEIKYTNLKQQITQTDEVFSERTQDIKTQIGIIKKDIRKAKVKLKDYQSIQIDDLVKRVSQKSALEIEHQGLLEEKALLTSKFSQIEQKYIALIGQLNNQKQKLHNEQSNQKNSLESEFLNTKEKLNSTYNQWVEDIQQSHQNRIKELDKQLNLIFNTQLKFSKKAIELKHKSYFDQALTGLKKDLENQDKCIQEADNIIKTSKLDIKTTQKEWNFNIEQSEASINLSIQKKQYEYDQINQKIINLKDKLDSSKDSLYDWLNLNVKDWNSNIGKVINENDVLFQKDLDPSFNLDHSDTIYGLKIDLSKINKPIKTIEDYTTDLQGLQDTLKALEQSILDLNSKLITSKKQFKKTYNTTITQLKELISTKEFEIERHRKEKESIRLQRLELEEKANKTKKEDLDNIEVEISKVNLEESEIKSELESLKKHFTTLLSDHKTKKDKQLEQAYSIFQDKLSELNSGYLEKDNQYNERINILKDEQKDELNHKGANTKRLSELEKILVETQIELNFIEKHRDKVAEYKKDKKDFFDQLDTFKSNKSELEEILVQETNHHKSNKDQLLELNESIKTIIDNINYKIKQYNKDLEKYDIFTKSESYTQVKTFINQHNIEHENALQASHLIDEINQNFYTVIKRYQDLQTAVNKFTGNFLDDNIFKFKTKFNSKQEYLQFAEMLKEFIEEDKISILEMRVNERFAHIIRQIGKETASILSKEDEIQHIINRVNNDFFSKNFVGAIKSMQMRIMPSSNKIMKLLIDIKAFNDEHDIEIGHTNLFTNENKDHTNKKAIKLVKTLIHEMHSYKNDEITLSDSFGLEFRILENDNDTGWVEKLSNVGSEGTDILVKAMINIMLLNVFKDNASKNIKNFNLHCMMDEIGKLHPTNVMGILKFANDRNIFLINSSPTSYNATDYKYTYLLSKDYNNVTRAKRLIKKTPTLLNV